MKNPFFPAHSASPACVFAHLGELHSSSYFTTDKRLRFMKAIKSFLACFKATLRLWFGLIVFKQFKSNHFHDDFRRERQGMEMGTRGKLETQKILGIFSARRLTTTQSSKKLLTSGFYEFQISVTHFPLATTFLLFLSIFFHLQTYKEAFLSFTVSPSQSHSRFNLCVCRVPQKLNDSIIKFHKENALFTNNFRQTKRSEADDGGGEWWK